MSYAGVKRALMALAIVLMIIMVSILAACLRVLKVGEVAVIYDPLTHSLRGPYVGPRYVIKMPWQGLIKDIYTVDVIDMTSEKDADYPPIKALTKDGVMITVEVSFTYSIDPDRFIDLVKNYPRLDYEISVLVPTMRQVVRDVISKHTIDDVIEHRDRIADEIKTEYEQRIASNPTLTAIRLHEVNLRNIDLPERVKAAIEQKIAAYQAKLAAQYERERILILAQAEAERKLIEAEAEANATLVRAEGLIRALQLIMNTTRDPELVRIYVMLEGLARLQNATLILVPPGAPFAITTPLQEER